MRIFWHIAARKVTVHEAFNGRMTSRTAKYHVWKACGQKCAENLIRWCEIAHHWENTMITRARALNSDDVIRREKQTFYNTHCHCPTTRFVSVSCTLCKGTNPHSVQTEIYEWKKRFREPFGFCSRHLTKYLALFPTPQTKLIESNNGFRFLFMACKRI